MVAPARYDPRRQRWVGTRGPRRPAPPASPSPGSFPLYLLALLLALLLFTSLLIPGEVGVRYGLLVLLFGAAAWLVVQQVYGRGVRVPPLQPAVAKALPVEGELHRAIALLERGQSGAGFSQVVAALRAREAFLARLAAERGLEEEEVEALLASPEALRRTVPDPLLREFLEDTAAREELLFAPGPDRDRALRFRRHGGFLRGLNRVLRAMEGWP